MKKHFKNFFKKSQNTLNQIKKRIEDLKKMENYEKDHYEKTTKSPKKTEPDKVIVHLSIASVAKATLVIMLLYITMQFAYEIRNIIMIVFVSLLLYAAIDPTVNKLEEKKIPRAISVLGLYLIFLAIIAFFISNLIPIVAGQLLELAKQAGSIITNFTEGHSLEKIPFSEKLIPYIQSSLDAIDQKTVISNVQGALTKIGEQLQNIAGNTFIAVKVVFNGIFNAVLVLVITFFLVTDRGSVDNFIKTLFPARYSGYIVEKSDKIKNKIGQWIRGIITLMFCMFTLYFIGFKILGLEYAITLAMMGGIAELFPVIGPVLAGVPAALIAFNESPWLILWVIGIIIIAQQVEGNILIPLVMRKAVGLKPAVIIISVLIGYQIFGLLGIILAVPIATTASIFIGDYLNKEK